MAKEVTMKDIAACLGISTVSVSKALTGKDGVSSQMRDMIRQKAEEMGYMYSATKSGKESRKFNIGVLVDAHYVQEQSGNFYFKMYQSIVLKLAQNHYSGILEILTEDMLQKMELPKVITDQKVDGIISLGKIEESYLKKVQETNLPLVYLDYYDQNMDIPSVITDNTYGTYMLMDYLIRKGHKKIAYVGDIHATPSILDRYLGYLRGLIEHHLSFREEYVICDRDKRGQYIDPVLPKDMPTAFVCNCDDIAKMLMEKLTALGYSLPDDISVVGFDNAPIAELTTPGLTTVQVDMDSMTQMSCDLLLRMIAGETDIHGRKVISGQLIIRDSVCDVKE